MHYLKGLRATNISGNSDRHPTLKARRHCCCNTEALLVNIPTRNIQINSNIFLQISNEIFGNISRGLLSVSECSRLFRFECILRTVFKQDRESETWGKFESDFERKLRRQYFYTFGDLVLSSGISRRLPILQRILLPTSSRHTIREAAVSSYLSVHMNQTIRRHIQEDRSPYSHGRWSLNVGHPYYDLCNIRDIPWTYLVNSKIIFLMFAPCINSIKNIYYSNWCTLL